MSSREEIFGVVKDHLVGRGLDADAVTPEADLANDVGLDSLDVTASASRPRPTR